VRSGKINCILVLLKFDDDDTTFVKFLILNRDDFYILEFSLHKIFVCDLVYYGVIMCYLDACYICMYTHGGLPHFDIYIQRFPRFQRCHSGGQRRYGSFIR